VTLEDLLKRYTERSFFLIMKIIDSKYKPMLIKALEIALAERATQAAALDEPEMAQYTVMLGAQDRQLLARLKKPAPFTVNGDALAISGALTAPLYAWMPHPGLLTAGFKVADIDELYDYVMDDLNKRINPNCRWSKKIADVRKANRMEIT
jgi:hypothetical protein